MSYRCPRTGGSRPELIDSAELPGGIAALKPALRNSRTNESTLERLESNALKPQRRLLRLKPAADYLSVSTWTLRRIIQEGELPIIKYGANVPWLLDVRDLDGWVEKHKATL